MTYSTEEKIQLPGNCVCIESYPMEAPGGERGRREVRECGEDSCGLA